MATERSKPVQLGWRKFLLSQAGVEGMLYLREKAPSVFKGTSEEMIFDSGKAQGYRDCLDTISQVIGVEPVRDVNASND